MFPDLDRDIIDDVVRVKEGRYVQFLSTSNASTEALTNTSGYRVHLAVEACLALSSS